MLLVLISVVPILALVGPTIHDMVGNGTLAAMTAVTLIALIGGHVLGGPDLRDRATLAIASCVRHPGIAISIAGASFDDPRISAAIVLFMLTGLFVTAIYSMWIKRQAQHAAPAE
jgi:BASS family bile acid:Na+ symporter